MPELQITGWDNGFSWRVIDLSSMFGTNNYTEVGITKYQFTTGGVTSISGIVDSVTPTSAAGTSYVTPTRDVYPYAPGTYTFWAYAKVPYGTYWPAGSATVTVTAPTVQRPSNWSWYSTIVSGGNVGLTAWEWTNFCNRINDFRSYAGLSGYSFTEVSSGVTKISAAIVNEARTAIAAIPGHGTLPSAAVSGGAMYASFFIGLRDALNSVP